jgi:hypothetical protein
VPFFRRCFPLAGVRTLNRGPILKSLRSAAGARADASGRGCVDTRAATVSLPCATAPGRVALVLRAISARRPEDILREAASPACRYLLRGAAAASRRFDLESFQRFKNFARLEQDQSMPQINIRDFFLLASGF